MKTLIAPELVKLRILKASDDAAQAQIFNIHFVNVFNQLDGVTADFTQKN